MNNILILRLSALGDVAMTVPVIYSVASQYPNVRFTVLTRPFFRRVFINAPSNISFIDFDSKKSHAGFRGLMRLIAELKKQRFSAVADLHDLLRTRIIRYSLRLSGVQVAAVDKTRKERKRLTERKERGFQKNYVDRYADVFARLGLPVNVNFQGVYHADEKERCGVGIAPFARYETKTYPPHLMEKVAERLTDAGISVTLFGAAGEEQKLLEQWVQRNPLLTSVAGRFPIEDEIKAMSRLKVMLTMDSANMHLASLVNTPVVSIWGSTIPQCGFLGYGQSVDDTVWLDLPCQPCSVAGLPTCPKGNNACLENITAEKILSKIRKYSPDFRILE